MSEQNLSEIEELAGEMHDASLTDNDNYYRYFIYGDGSPTAIPSVSPVSLTALYAHSDTGEFAKAYIPSPYVPREYSAQLRIAFGELLLARPYNLVPDHIKWSVMTTAGTKAAYLSAVKENETSIQKPNVKLIGVLAIYPGLALDEAAESLVSPIGAVVSSRQFLEKFLEIMPLREILEYIAENYEDEAVSSAMKTNYALSKEQGLDDFDTLEAHEQSIKQALSGPISQEQLLNYASLNLVRFMLPAKHTHPIINREVFGKQ
jgi:hypothetical protein